MQDLIALEHALLASIIGMTLICSVVALAIGAGYWFLERQRRINLDQIEQQRQDELKECVQIRPLLVKNGVWFGYRDPVTGDRPLPPPAPPAPPTEELVIHLCVGPCLSESDIAEIEAEQVQKEEMETWSL